MATATRTRPPARKSTGRSTRSRRSGTPGYLTQLVLLGRALAALWRGLAVLVGSLARAVGRVHAYDFQKIGILSFYRETLGSSLDLGVDVMHTLGMERTRAEHAAQLFKEHDSRSVRELAQYWEDDDAYFKNARQHIEAFERMFASDAAAGTGPAENAAPTSAKS